MNDLKIYAQNLESAAMEQIETLANAPAFEGAKIRIMPMLTLARAASSASRQTSGIRWCPTSWASISDAGC